MRIRPTELHGLRPLMEMACLLPNVWLLRGMEYDGSLEVMEQLQMRIRLMGSIGLRLLPEMLCLEATVLPPHHVVYCLI